MGTMRLARRPTGVPHPLRPPPAKPRNDNGAEVNYTDFEVFGCEISNCLAVSWLGEETILASAAGLRPRAVTSPTGCDGSVLGKPANAHPRQQQGQKEHPRPRSRQ